MITCPPKQYDQASKSPRVTRRLRQWSILHVHCAALPRNLVNVAVALAVVLGSRSVEMWTTQSLSIHGPRVCRLAKVSCGQAEFCGVHIDCYHLTEACCFVNHHIRHSDCLSAVTGEAMDMVSPSPPGALSPSTATIITRVVTTPSATTRTLIWLFECERVSPVGII